MSRPCMSVNATTTVSIAPGLDLGLQLVERQHAAILRPVDMSAREWT